jgi:hypothetical protein
MIGLFHYLRFRLDTGIFTYDEYKYIGTAEKLISANLSLVNLRDNLQDPIPIFLAFSKNNKLYINLIPYFFIIINFLLIYALGEKTQINEKHKLFSLISILLSPLFIYIHITFNMALICVSLIFAGAILFNNNKPFFGLFFFLFSIWINPWTFFVIFVFLLFVFQKLKETKKNFDIIAYFSIVVLFLFLKGFRLSTSVDLMQIGKTYITDLGAIYGLGIFGIITATIGMILYLRNKDNEKTPILFIVLLAFFSMYDKFFLVFFDILAAYFSGYAAFKIIYGNWESSILKNYVTLLIFCGLIFSAGSYLNKSYKAGANYGERISVEWLKNHAANDKVILSYYEFGYLLSSNNTNVFTDKDYYFNSKEKSRITQSEEIFMSRDLKKTLAFLEKNKINYIWINQAMKKNLVWSKDNEGMQFIMQNSVRFNKVYDYLGVEIWEYKSAP